MNYCPSMDWDRHINEQDEAAEAEMRFYKTYRAELVQLCAAAMSAGYENPQDIVADAAIVMQEIIARSGEEF